MSHNFGLTDGLVDDKGSLPCPPPAYAMHGVEEDCREQSGPDGRQWRRSVPSDHLLQSGVLPRVGSASRAATGLPLISADTKAHPHRILTINKRISKAGIALETALA